MAKKPEENPARELTRVKRELAALRERYFNLYDLAPVGILTLDAKGVVHEANLAVAAMLGVEKDQVLNRALGDFVQPEDRDLYSRFFKRFPAKDAPPATELRMRRAIAAPFCARLELTLGHDAGGSLLYRVVMSDVTERVKTQTDLLRLRAAVDQAHDGLAIADMEGRLQFANRAWARMHGYAPEELRDAEGEVTGLVGLADDITERRKSEEAFARMLAEREAILKSIPDLFYRVDADMNLQDWNQVYERVSGYSPNELKGMHALAFFKTDAKLIAEGITEAVQKGQAYRTARFLTKKGAEIPVFWSAAALRAQDGSLQGIVGIGRDLTVK